MLQAENSTFVDGATIAKHTKYLLQLANPYVVYKLPFERVQSKSIYLAHKKRFDALAQICSKYKIDPIAYVNYFINVLHRWEKDIDNELLSVQTFKAYGTHVQILNKHNKTYKLFMDTVRLIVADCIKFNYNSVLDYLRMLISSKKLAAYYVAGKISTYYLAAIPNFKKVIDKLDSISRDEFKELYDRYDKYHTDINEAFLHVKNIKVNPIKLTDEAIFSAKNRLNA